MRIHSVAITELLGGMAVTPVMRFDRGLGYHATEKSPLYGDCDFSLMELQTMKRVPYLLSALVVSATPAKTMPGIAQEGDAFASPNVIDEPASEVPSSSRSKGALEPGGQPMGETAPLNGDRSAAPTGGNQSGRPESMRITKEIRQQIIERRELSTAAKNVKVITDDKGAVTLRGPVKTDDERRELEQIARNNAQGGQVNNQLVVKGEEPSRGGAHG